MATIYYEILLLSYVINNGISLEKLAEILYEGETTVSNNFAKRHQNGFKIGTRDQ